MPSKSAPHLAFIMPSCLYCVRGMYQGQLRSVLPSALCPPRAAVVVNGSGGVRPLPALSYCRVLLPGKVNHLYRKANLALIDNIHVSFGSASCRTLVTRQLDAWLRIAFSGWQEIETLLFIAVVQPHCVPRPRRSWGAHFS